MSLTPTNVAVGTTGLPSAPAAQGTATECRAATLPHPPLRQEVRQPGRADAVMQGAVLPAPQTAAVALALLGLALLPALRRRPARPAASP